MENQPFSPPYKKARLVNADKPLSVRWYIVLWVWDGAKKKLVRKRDYDINKIEGKQARIKWAKKRIDAYNEILKDGNHINPEGIPVPAKSPALHLKTDFTIREAFDYVLRFVQTNKRHATYNTYSSCANLFLGYCDQQGWQGHKITQLQKMDILAYLDFVQHDRGLNNCTRNQYLGHTRSLLRLMVDRDIIKVNPAAGIKEEPEDIGGNTAYLPAQIKTLKEALQAQNPRLWLFVQFIFYGFIRPAEIGRLRVKNITLAAGQIFLPGAITKNRKPRYVKISPALKLCIEELNLGRYEAEHYVFGHSLITGPRPLQKNFATAGHTAIARDLKFGPEYTLYSWKHTGVVLHYQAGIDIKTIQAQLGHQSLQETDTYLKSLNLYENNEFELKSPVI